MPFQKGMQKVPGSGRKKGTPNNATKFGVDTILGVLSKYKESGKLSKDWNLLEPYERLSIAAKLLPFIMPKKTESSVSVSGNKTIEDTLIELSNE